MAVQHPGSETRVAAMFDRIAPRYDLLNRLLSARQDQRWRKRLVSMIPFRPQGRYLDVATGTGDVLLAARAAHAEYGSFVGVDISKQMLRVAERKLRAEAGTRVPATELKPMSAESLQVETQSVDCLSIAFGLRNVVDRPRAIAEFQRVLKPGGVLLILEFFVPRTGLLALLFQLYFHRILPVVGALLSDKDAYRYLPQSVGSFYAPDELRHVLLQNGLTMSEEVPFLFGACRLIKATRT